MANIGQLCLRVPTGRLTSAAGGEAAPENLFVQITLPAGLTKHTTVACDRADNFQFRFQKQLELQGRITPGMKLKVTLVQWNRILANQPLGSFDVSLEPLSRGAEIEPAEMAVNDKFKVTFGANWKNPPPDVLDYAAGAAGSGAGLAAQASMGAAGAPGAAPGAGAPGGGGAMMMISSPTASRKPLPDATGQTYNVRIKIHRLKNLQSLTPDPDPYNARCVVKVADKSYKTEVVKKSFEPVFDEECSFTFEKCAKTFWTEPISINVINNRMLVDEKIGLILLDVGAVYRERTHAFARKWWVIKRDVGEGTVMGYAKCSIAVTNSLSDATVEFDDTAGAEVDDDEEDEDIIANLVNTPGAVFEERFLHVFAVSAAHLPKMDSGIGGTADPYFKVTFGQRSAKCDPIDNTLMPMWNAQITVPMMMPCLTNYCALQIWDSDTLDPDDLCATYHLDINEISRGRGDLRLSPRYFNFVSAPRSYDADFNRYMKEMVRGQKPGVDFRGRALLGIMSAKQRAELPKPAIHETVLSVCVRIELLQLSHIPTGDDIKIKAFMQTTSKTTPAFKTRKMLGEGSETYAAFVGQTLELVANVRVTVPDEADENGFLNSAASRADKVRFAVWQQMPPVVVHVIVDSTLGSFADKMTGALDEDPIAAIVIPATDFYEQPDGNFTVYKSASMATMTDPDRAGDGDAPSSPLLQLNCGVFVVDSIPKAIAVPNADPKQKFQSVFAGKPASSGGKNVLLSTFLYHAKNVPAGDSTGLCDPYVVISWANTTAKCGYALETLNPTWNEALHVVATVHDPLPDLCIELFDYDRFASDDFLARRIVTPAEIKEAGGHVQWLDGWEDARGRALADTAVLLALVIDEKGSAAPAAANKVKMVRANSDTYKGFPIPEGRRLATAKYALNLKVLGLRNMRKMHLRNVSAPKVVFEVYGHRVETGTADELLNLNAEMAWTLTLPFDDNVNILPQLQISVYDHRFMSSTLVAVCCLPLDSDFLDPQAKKQRALEATHAVQTKLRAIIDTHKKLERADLAREANSGGNMFTPSAGGAGGAGGAAMDGRPSASASNLEAGGGGDEDELNKGLLAHGSSPSDYDLRSAQEQLSNNDIEQKMRDALEKLEDDALSESDVASDASSEADESQWYDRYDPSAAAADPNARQTKYYERVARLGKLGRHCKHFRQGKTTAEDCFGATTDGTRHLQLYRGWGKSAVKAGSLNLEASLVRVNAQGAGAAAADAAAAEKKFTAIAERKRTPFLCRVYILTGRELTAMDSGIFGRFSDPYCILTLSSGSGNSSKNDVIVNCRDQTRYSVLNPDWFFVRELSGELPQHSTLRVSVFDYDKVSISDDLIGFTDINLEERYFSSRGYAQHAQRQAEGRQLELQDPACFYGLNHYGSYTERRVLRSEGGINAGTIELWVDMFDFSAPVPRPIDVAPPPPIPLELRCIVWDVRDCDLVDESLVGDIMSDIFVKVFPSGMPSQEQSTDVHYRSLDGSGSFNWRTVFRFAFDPRLRKIFEIADLSTKEFADSEAGGTASTAVSKFFSVRKEAKKLKPRLTVATYDSDLLSNDHIGSATLDLTHLQPVATRREQVGLVKGMTQDCRDCWLRCPCHHVCNCKFCEKQNEVAEMTLEERQVHARKERETERKARKAKIDAEVEGKLKTLRSTGRLSDAELDRARARLTSAAKKEGKINIFAEFLPSHRKRSERLADDAKYSQELQRRAEKHGAEDASAIAPKPSEAKKKPESADVARRWYTMRGSQGGCRSGDVQLSFEVVRLDALEKDPSLAVDKGNEGLPKPQRSEENFLWLSSPYKAFIHVLWRKYKFYVITFICIILALLYLYVFTSTGVSTKSTKFFA